MAFKGLADWTAARRAEWDSHVRPEIRARVESGLPISAAEWAEIRCNSYEQQELLPLLETAALLAHTRSCLANCGTEKPRGWNGRSPNADTPEAHGRELAVPVHYDSAVVHVLLPLIMERLEAAEKQLVAAKARETQLESLLKAARWDALP